MTDKKKKVRFNAITREYVDQDYRSKLSDQDKAWLDQFNKEYYDAIYGNDIREHHSPDYDENLRAARSARRKDLYGRLYGERGGTDGLDFDDIPDVSMYEKQEDEDLHKMDANEAMEIIVSQATDIIESGLYDVKSEIRNAVKRGINLFIKAKKSK